MKSERIESIDLLRGIVMILMVLDHTRDFYFNHHINPTDLTKTNTFLFLTRWVTHLCAPVFVFLAGASAYIYGSKHSSSQLRKFLLTRGIWLVFLELTVISFGWRLGFSDRIYLGVIWAIGTSMILLSLISSLPISAILSLSILIIVGHNGLTSHLSGSLNGWLEQAYSFLMSTGMIQISGITIKIHYVILPWFATMAGGYAFARWFYDRSLSDRNRLCVILGGMMLGLFVVLRTFNIYGDPLPWSTQESSVKTMLSFLNVTKYPPSLLYLCVTLGIALMMLPLIESIPQGNIRRSLLSIGRVPMMFYIVHLYVLSCSAYFIGKVFHHRESLNDSLGYSLTETWAVWALIIVILAPVCKAYAKYKQNHKYWWLSYL